LATPLDEFAKWRNGIIVGDIKLSNRRNLSISIKHMRPPAARAANLRDDLAIMVRVSLPPFLIKITWTNPARIIRHAKGSSNKAGISWLFGEDWGRLPAGEAQVYLARIFCSAFRNKRAMLVRSADG